MKRTVRARCFSEVATVCRVDGLLVSSVFQTAEARERASILEAMAPDRGELLADESLTGSRWCLAHSDLVDGWLRELFGRAVDGDERGLALVAIGGYGRRELCPQSDIDLMLVHDKRPDIRSVADRLWYPVWDAGFHLGHSVTTVDEALTQAADDLDTATALLSARHLAGDEQLAARLERGGRDQWRKKARRWLAQLSARVTERHRAAGEVAFTLEPDLKDGRGGLRDVHSLHWAEAAQPTLLDHDAAQLQAAYATILDARVELQRATGRASNLLALQEQAAVAAALGHDGADSLMAALATAARTVTWTSDDTWRRIDATLRGPLKRIAQRNRPIAPGIQLRDGEIVADREHRADAIYPLQVALAASHARAAIDRHSLEALAAGNGTLPTPWPAEVRDAFVDLLRAGEPAIRVIEALDQRDVWTRYLPEWRAVRARPQRNAYHRFTVDRHLLEATANAARLTVRVARPDLLLVGTLLHDIGKGFPGDHTEAGMEQMRIIAGRMGFDGDDVDTLTALVEHHLLLPDVATRRDLDDPATIQRVADTIGSLERLRLLAALTEADSIATGPAAWSPWKAELVAQLADRVEHILGGGAVEALPVQPFPSAEQLARLRQPGRSIAADGDTLTVMTDDRPGVFSRVAGVLSLHGLDVMTANAYSTDDGRALAEFRVDDPFHGQPDWGKVIASLELAFDGRLALNARVAERARTYGKNTRKTAPAARATVSFDTDASADATVIDVHAPDGVGVLYRITRALAELDLDIRSAKVQTMGSQVVDAFYVRDRHGNKVDDRQTLREIERAILHNLTTDA
jgi:[protein-PII] uridylyltransferase